MLLSKHHPLWFIAFALLVPWLTALALVPDVHESEANTRIVWAIALMGIIGYARLFSLLHLIAPLLIVAGSVDLLYAIAFHGVFSTATFEAIAATNPAEALEFIPAYATGINIIALLTYTGIALWLWWNARPLASSRMVQVHFLLALLLLILIALRIADGKVRDSLFGVISAGVTYQQANQGVVQESLHRQKLVEVYQQTHQVTQQDSALKTLVVVIGESMNRHHLGLYGYPRQTTPELSALAEAHPQTLFVFRNVISSHVQTQPSLRYALTRASLYQQTDPYQSLSMVDLAKLAGVKTWWLSNQQPLRGSITAIAKQADYEYYVSNDHQGIADTLDEALIPQLTQALADPAEHKLIVLHLMGSHLQYSNRYPTAFDHYQDTPPRPYQSTLSSRQQNNINQYDNSVRYTDHLLGKIIAQMPQNQPVGLVFFADHGEEVYDTTDFKGHGPESLTRVMFEIPLLVWLNQQAQSRRPEWVSGFQQAEHHPTMLDHIDHLITQLLGLTDTEQENQHTLGHPAWQAHPRMVYGKDYDR